MGIKTIAVPKSGCFKIIPIGTITIRAVIKKVLRFPFFSYSLQLYNPYLKYYNKTMSRVKPYSILNM